MDIRWQTLNNPISIYSNEVIVEDKTRSKCISCGHQISNILSSKGGVELVSIYMNINYHIYIEKIYKLEKSKLHDMDLI